MSSYLVLANADAGSAEQEAVERAASVLRRGGEVTVVWTRNEGELHDAVADLDGQTLVIAGGDGSVHAAVQALNGAGALRQPVGLLPAGTGNDLARNLALPLNLDEAAGVILNGRSVPLSLLRKGDQLIHNNIHVGMGLEAAKRATGLKPVLGKAAYTVGAVVAGLSFDGVELRVEVDGQAMFEGTALACVVMLGPSLGGGREITGIGERSSPTADILVVEATDRFRRLGLIPDYVQDGLLDRDDVDTTRGVRVRISSPEPLEADLDGEIQDVGNEIDLEVVPEALRVFVPSSMTSG